MFGLEHEKGVAVCEETVLFFDCFLVRFHRQFVSRKGRSRHKQRALWGVEVGNQRVGDLEIELGVDKSVRPTGERLERLREV